jgi:hypothetical protein
MNVTAVLQSQFHAALAMLEQAVRKCPASIWDDEQDENRFWSVAYHTLYFVHLYLQTNKAAFVPWAKDRGEEGQYTPTEILEYLNFCRNEVAQKLPTLDTSAPSGFDWLPFDKLELQIYNIRHIQQHAGELYERLGVRAGIELHWVSRKAAARSQ